MIDTLKNKNTKVIHYNTNVFNTVNIDKDKIMLCLKMNLNL